MENNMVETPSLHEAWRRIEVYARQMGGESVALQDALLRLPVHALRALKPQPGYSQSTRDGFVVSGEGFQLTAGGHRFRVAGEIRAGGTDRPLLRDGTAIRIMTGGLVPPGGVRVIPQEACDDRDGVLIVPETALQQRNTFIRKRGCEIGKGRVVVPAGMPILPDHLVLLAATGYSAITVHRRPRVTFFCTGSELVATPEEEAEGFKVSGNRYLLGGLVRMFGGITEDFGMIIDSREELSRAFDRIDRRKTDVILSTGGLGPGKYDLLEEAFMRAGGRVVFRSLHVRPGKSMLFGMLGQALFFGLPGPPPAVRVLFNELVGPALFFLQGMKRCGPPKVRLVLQDSVVLKEKGVPSLKPGIFVKEGVRLAGKAEIPECYILFPGSRRNMRRGERVTGHLVIPRHPCAL